MKIQTLFCLLLACLGLQSCKKNQSQVVAAAPQVQSETCYKALYENDTLDLKVNTLENGKISGTLNMNVFNEPKRVGTIAGEFRGDTLFCSYTFSLAANKKITFKNPMAFLKQANELILGNGKIENSMGVSYFVKGIPIDFKLVKYHFTTIDCIKN